MSRSARRSGLKWETEFIRKWLAPLFRLKFFNGKNFDEAQVGSARMFDRSLDAAGVDVWFRRDVREHIRRLRFQNKKSTSKGKTVTSIDVQSLERMNVEPDDIRILLSKVYTSPKKNRKYATLPLEDLIQILSEWHELKMKCKD